MFRESLIFETGKANKRQQEHSDWKTRPQLTQGTLAAGSSENTSSDHFSMIAVLCEGEEN